jgi:hypothetical protein
MARGWESKSIESQQEDAATRRSTRPALTPEQQAAQQKKTALELSRARLADDLSRATSPNHRGMLEHALANLDEQLARIG